MSTLLLTPKSVRLPLAGRPAATSGPVTRIAAGPQRHMHQPRTHQPDSQSLSDLIAASYPALRRMASARAARTGMPPSSLAHETICRLLKLPTPPKDTEALEGIAWQLMDWALLDRLRSSSTRDRHERAAGDSPPHASNPRSLSPRTITMSKSLAALAEHSPRKAEVMTLWAIGGLSMEQISKALDLSAKTIQRDLDFARAWLAAASTKDLS